MKKRRMTNHNFFLKLTKIFYGQHIFFKLGDAAREYNQVPHPWFMVKQLLICCIVNIFKNFYLVD